MILDYKELRQLFKGTPLESISDQKLNDVMVGEYPLMFSDKQLRRIWDRCISDNEGKLKEVKIKNAIIILSEFNALSISKGRLDTSEALEAVISLLNSIRFDYVTISTQSEIIKHQEREILRYEKKIREQAKQIELLKEGI